MTRAHVYLALAAIGSLTTASLAGTLPGLQDITVIDYAISGSRPGWGGGLDALSWSSGQNANFDGTASLGFPSGDGVQDTTTGEVWQIDSRWSRYSFGPGFDVDLITSYLSADDPATPLATGDSLAGSWTIAVSETVDIWINLQSYSGLADPSVISATMTSSGGTVIDLAGVVEPTDYASLVSLTAGTWTLDISIEASASTEFIGMAAFFADPSLFGPAPVPAGPVPIAVVVGIGAARRRRR